eukprot:1157635-Pelagomonas_calceolata.AAC.7
MPATLNSECRARWVLCSCKPCIAASVFAQSGTQCALRITAKAVCMTCRLSMVCSMHAPPAFAIWGRPRSTNAPPAHLHLGRSQSHKHNTCTRTCRAHPRSSRPQQHITSPARVPQPTGAHSISIKHHLHAPIWGRSQKHKLPAPLQRPPGRMFNEVDALRTECRGKNTRYSVGQHQVNSDGCYAHTLQLIDAGFPGVCRTVWLA